MGVILHNQLNNSCSMGLWEITEGYDELLSRLILKDDELSVLNGFRNNNRKIEWLSVRVLINSMTGVPSRIVYNEARKPFLKDKSFNISISHSHKFTSILMSRDRLVGIDLEYMSHRIEKIANRFISDDEYVTTDTDLVKYHLYIHWCAKEALFKICDKKDIHFRKDIIIEPFQPMEKGHLKAIVKTSNHSERFDLSYFRIDNYIIVWCCK